MASQVITTISATGKAVKTFHRAGVRTSPLGTFDPTTGKVWRHPRLTLNPIPGRSVRVTNPKATLKSSAEMTGSLGMGGIGQRGRVSDVGSTKARGEA